VEDKTIHPLDGTWFDWQYHEFMTNVYLADARPEERLAFRLLLKDLNMRVVGEGADWQTVISTAPGTKPDLLLVDWGLVSNGSGCSLSALRALCSPEVQIILISNFDTREQAAVSTGADAFISKTEMIDNVANLLMDAAKKAYADKLIHNSRQQAHVSDS
jgi:DNA-binding NarL/FixJ family response regulator